jgi:serine/threonine protein kinase/regulator of sirC expression with transglutaminase-like and TPR domain
MWIGSYEVVSTLGQGGMGVVYGARSLEGRDVAIKVLRQSAPETLVRFGRERRLLASLGEAQGFVALLDAGSSEGGPYLVMPLVPGGTLRERLEHGPLGIDEALALGVRLASALGEAHGRGIVHRDMKPENILFTADGLPLIADLGLAKHFDPGAPGASQSVSVSEHGVFRGTAGYMAPEQMADAKSVGPPADVFSLGAILYECLAGKPPFLGESPLEVLTRVSDGKVKPLREHRADVPASLALVVERALAPAVPDRFPHGSALAGALGAPRPRPRRRLLALAVLVATGVLAAALLLGRSRPASRPGPDARALALEAIDAIDSSDDALGEKLTARAFALDPSCGVAFTARGYLLAQKGDRKAAMAALDRGVALDPGSPVTWAQRGNAWGDLGEQDKAIADLTRAIAVDPGFAYAWRLRALARNARGDDQGALVDLDRAIALAPDNVLGLRMRGSFRARRQDRAGALADHDRVVALDPRNAGSWSGRGTVKYLLGDTDGAFADYTRAIELDPKDAVAWSGLGGLKLAKQDYPGATADLDRAIELDPRSADNWDRRSEGRFGQGDVDGAIADLDRAFELDPKEVTRFMKRSFARTAKGDLDGAIADLERFLELAPDHAHAPDARAKLARLQQARNAR